MLTLLTVTNRHCKKSYFTTYLGALAITDALVNSVGLLDGWLFFGFGVDILSHHVVSCKIMPFCHHLFEQLSACLVATLTVDRMVVTYFPLRKSIKTKKIAYGVVGSIFGFSLLVNTHEFYGFTIIESESFIICIFVDDNYELFFMFYFAWVDIAVYCFLPMLLIIGSNMVMVVKIYRSTSHLRALKHAQRRS